jgi:probable F420-dependent oxidoreductase
MDARRPFRFGMMGEHVRTAQELTDTARAAEETGYATFLLRDHFIEEPFGHQLAPLTALATAAAVTRNLRIGSMVFAHDYRHPVLLAKEVATLDQLSGGRFELGLGAGFSRPEYEQAGMTFDPPAARVRRFAETLAVLKGLFADPPLTFSGEHHTITDLDSFPKPAQRPHPPILIGAGGRRMLTIAAREADSIGILTASIVDGALQSKDPRGMLAGSIAERIGWIRDAAGARFDGIELSLFCSVVLTEGSREDAAEQLARTRGWQDVRVDDVLAMPSVYIGTLDRVVDEMIERRERYGISYHIVLDQHLHTVAPLVVRLAGA